MKILLGHEPFKETQVSNLSKSLRQGQRSNLPYYMQACGQACQCLVVFL